MDYFDTAVIEEGKTRSISELSDTVKKNRLSGPGVISVFVESAVMGLSLFLAFVIQKMYFDLENHQFLLGQGELMRMSAGMAFCYAFVFVLRRGYLSVPGNGKKKIALMLRQYIFESYVLYLALLFLVRDINFRSVKLALGIGFIISVILLFSYEFAISVIFLKKKMHPGMRKITLKKLPLPSALIGQSGREKNIVDGHTVPPGDEPRFDKSVKDGVALNSGGDKNCGGRSRCSGKL